MRDVMLLIGGLADAGPGETGGKTALEAARTPTLDGLATDGVLGLTRLVGDGVAPTTTATTLAALGCEAGASVAPGVAVATGLGHAVSPGEQVAVLDLVTAGVDDAGVEIVSGVGGAYLPRAVRAALGGTLAEGLRTHGVTVLSGCQSAVVVTPEGFAVRPGPPWAALGTPLAGSDSDAMLRRAARTLIQDAPVVMARRSGGAPVPTDVWVWGAGDVPQTLPPFRNSGIVLADEPAALGVGRLVGLDVAPLGAPEDDDASWERVVPTVLSAIESHVFTLVHVDAVDVVSHRGDAAGKTALIETLDRELIAPLRAGLEHQGGDWRFAVLASHATSTTTRAHTPDPVPFLVYAGRAEHRAPHSKRRFHERDAREQGIFIPDGHGLVARLVRR